MNKWVNQLSWKICWCAFKRYIQWDECVGRNFPGTEYCDGLILEPSLSSVCKGDIYAVYPFSFVREPGNCLSCCVQLNLSTTEFGCTEYFFFVHWKAFTQNWNVYFKLDNNEQVSLYWLRGGAANDYPSILHCDRTKWWSNIFQCAFLWLVLCTPNSCYWLIIQQIDVKC